MFSPAPTRPTQSSHTHTHTHGSLPPSSLIPLLPLSPCCLGFLDVSGSHRAHSQIRAFALLFPQSGLPFLLTATEFLLSLRVSRPTFITHCSTYSPPWGIHTYYYLLFVYGLSPLKCAFHEQQTLSVPCCTPSTWNSVRFIVDAQ